MSYKSKDAKITQILLYFSFDSKTHTYAKHTQNASKIKTDHSHIHVN